MYFRLPNNSDKEKNTLGLSEPKVWNWLRPLPHCQTKKSFWSQFPSRSKMICKGKSDAPRVEDICKYPINHQPYIPWSLFHGKWYTLQSCSVYFYFLLFFCRPACLLSHKAWKNRNTREEKLKPHHRLLWDWTKAANKYFTAD